MKVVVFGATGKTGEIASRNAIEAGHDVTVFGRSVDHKFADDNVNRVQGNVLEGDVVGKAIGGQDAVLVCLGPVSTRDRTTLSVGARNISDAMKEHGVGGSSSSPPPGLATAGRASPGIRSCCFRPC